MFIHSKQIAGNTSSTSEIQTVLLLICLVLSLILLGTLGYSLLEGWSLLNSFYMTVITLSTVGFGEVHNLTPLGKLFTTGLIFAGVGIAAYSFTFVTRSIVEGEIRQLRGTRKMRKHLSSLKDHTIVCGYGRLGQIVADGLLSESQNVVIIENSPEQVKLLSDTNALVIVGSAYEDKTLLEAGIERAKHILALLPTDADNLYIILCARELNSKLNIVARAESAPGEKRLRLAGANQVVAPYNLSGIRIVQQILRPNVSDFLEVAAGRSGNKLALEEVVIPSNSALCGQTVYDSRLRDRTGIIIAAFITPEGKMIFNPHRDSLIEAGSTMIVLGENDSLAKLSEIIENV